MRKILDILPPFVLCISTALVVIYLTLMPKPLGDVHIPLFEGADKVVHFLMFFGFAGCCFVDYKRWRMRNVALWAIFSGVALGAIVEVAQEAMGIGRSGDWIDFVADTAGGVLGCVSAIMINKKWFKY